MEFVGCCHFSLGRHCREFYHMRNHGVPYPPSILILENLIARIVGQFPFRLDDSARETSRRLCSKRRDFLAGEFRRYNWNVCCLRGSCVGFVGNDPVPVPTRGLFRWSGKSRYPRPSGFYPRPRAILGLYVLLLNAPRYSYFRCPDERTVVDFLDWIESLFATEGCRGDLMDLQAIRSYLWFGPHRLLFRQIPCSRCF